MVGIAKPLLLVHFSFKTLNRCSFETKKRTRVLAVVSSKYNHFEVREAHRKSFDNSMLQRLGMRRIFVLGNPPGLVTALCNTCSYFTVKLTKLKIYKREKMHF